MTKYAPVPLKKAARSSLAGFVHSLTALVAANKGTLDASKAESAKNVPEGLTLSLRPSASSPIASELELIVEAAQAILTKYSQLDASFVLPAKEAVRGQNDLTGKTVYIRESAPTKLKQRFGQGGRKVLREEENTETGEALVVFAEDGGEFRIGKTSVVLKRAS